ncbi:type IV pilin protein [Undibacterium curvum]|jgi:type IV pilus assembly protein PilE|uniref:Type IV pilin protein n=1 Tax=Undibacterium curvum TaxID=2762294 RepID=A0ABR7A9R7_9BURK|nr:type IV pilin protein [Undibacterium curvum]MBC3933625.1 type IV pilin protein [Undibacterium curvum]
MKKNNGFSLIELVIVVAILGLITAFAVPAYQSHALKTKRAEAKTALVKLMLQEEQFYTQNNSYIVFSQSSTDAAEKKFTWFSGATAPVSNYEIKATACTGDVIQSCVLLTAMPGTINVNKAFSDAVCGNLTLTSTGVKGFTGSQGTKDLCW